MRQALLALVAIGLVASLAGAGTMAYFSDTETVGVHDIQAGTLNLKVAERGETGPDPCRIHITIEDIKPRSDGNFKWDFINTGSLDGILSVEIANVVNKENGCYEPEWNGAGDTKGDTEGELGDHLNFKMIITDSDGETKDSVWWDNPRKLGKPIALNKIAKKGLCEVPGTPGLLKAGETEAVWIHWVLPDKTGNIVQSDSVEFDIIFHLVQAE